jgi:hypothetical protein
MATHTLSGARSELPRAATPERNSIVELLPIMAVVAIAFLVIGFALPVLPLHVHHGLGLSTFIVGLVTGSQFIASVISRVWAGHFADRRGPQERRCAGSGRRGRLGSRVPCLARLHRNALDFGVYPIGSRRSATNSTRAKPVGHAKLTGAQQQRKI